MHVAATFSEPGAGAVLALLKAGPLATLVCAGPGGLEASPVPMVIETEHGRPLALGFHLAAANPLCALLDGARPALAVFSGPDAYVSPRWYASRGLPPTWNYAAVHVHGTPRALGDAALAEMLERLTGASEAPLHGDAWTVAALGDEAYAGMRRAIRGYRMPCARVEAKWKMSQNRAPADREGAAAGLRAHGGEQAVAVAGWVERVLAGNE